MLEEIQEAIAQGQPRYVERLVADALQTGATAAEILEGALVPGMRAASAYYREHPDEVPRLLACARCVRIGMDLLESDQGDLPVEPLGKVILGTMEGDLHDLGKSIVAAMFRTVGFQVIDLGVDVRERDFLNALRENPDTAIVCLSTMIDNGLDQMRRIVHSIRRKSGTAGVRIMVGGAPVTEEFAREIGADAYSENAVDAAELAKGFVK